MQHFNYLNANNLKAKQAHKAGFKLSLVALAIATISSSYAAEADTKTVESNNVEFVEVVGQAAQIDKALKEQRISDSIQSVVHADAIGQLPDDNAAEALQRIPGVSVERDQGEGRFVSVRGLGADLNSVNINGTLVPAPESGRRAVALDVLPTELIQSLSVVKSLTPDLDANSLGGTINVKSLSAYDHKGFFYTLSGEGSYNEKTSDTSPKVSGAISNIFSVGGGTNNLGIAAAFSVQERKFGSDNVETGGDWDFSNGPRLESFEQRDYEIQRDRLGFGLNFDYKHDETSSYYLRTLFSKYRDTETRNAAGVEFDNPLLVGQTDAAEGFRELKSRQETQEIQSYVFGGEKTLGLWTVNGQIGYSKSSEDSPLGIASALFEGNNDFVNAGFDNSKKPRLNIDPAFYDPNEFELAEVVKEKQYTSDTEKNIKFDIARDYDWNGNPSQVKFGAKASRRDKKNDLQSFVFDNFGANPTSLADYTAGPVDYSLDNFGNGISAGAINNLVNGLNASAAFDEEESRINDYKMSEDINAAYVMNSIDIDKWRFIAGLRYEGTDFKAQGTGINNGNFENISRSNKYHNLLPGLHARYQLNSSTQLRGAWTNTVVRPTFEALSPGFVIDGNETSFGNPDLDPLEASNFDFGIEHYMGRAGVLSAFAFYKDIDNFVYNTDLAGTGAFVAFDEANTFANGEKAKLYGLEVAYSQKLEWLPYPWSNFILGANATISASDASISGQGQKRDIDLPNQSKRVGNLSLGWEDAKFSVRISANYKSSFLTEVAAIDDPQHDLYADAQTYVDLSASYFITPKVQLTFQAQNITDEDFYVYTGRSQYNAQYEEYGPTYRVSLTLTDF